MDVLISKHAHEQMLRRGINRETVLKVVSFPDQTMADKEEPSKIIYQSIINENDKMFLLRVFVNIDKQPNIIVTVYKTTKISKYYEVEI
jgi:hypothetical protein